MTKVCLLAKGLSISQTCIKTRYTNLSNCLLHNVTFRLVTHSGCLHLSNTPLRVRRKTEPLKLHNGLWCRVCAPYGYVLLSHLGNIVLTNEIATFHNGGISSTKCATLVISVFLLRQKRMKTVLSNPNNSAFIYLLNMLPERSYICVLK